MPVSYLMIQWHQLIDWLCVRVCVFSVGTQDYGSGDEADGPPGTRSRRHSSPGESRSGSATELHVQEYADSVGSPRLDNPTPPLAVFCHQCFVSLLNVLFLYCSSVCIMFRATFCGKNKRRTVANGTIDIYHSILDYIALFLR